MLTIGRNVLSDPSRVIQSARFVQEEVRPCEGWTAQHRTAQRSMGKSAICQHLQLAVPPGSSLTVHEQGLAQRQ